MKYNIYLLLISAIMLIGVACSKDKDPQPGNCTDDWVFFSVPYVNEINSARTQLGNSHVEEDIVAACERLKNALNSYLAFLDEVQQCDEVPLAGKVQSEIDKTAAELDQLGEDCK